MTLLIDTGNIYHCIRKKFGIEKRIDYSSFVESVCQTYGSQDNVIAYVTHPDERANKFADYLRCINISVEMKDPKIIKVGENTYKQTDWAVEITLAAINSTSPVILGTSDIRFLPLVKAGYIAGIYAAGIPRAYKAITDATEIQEELLQNEVG